MEEKDNAASVLGTGTIQTTAPDQFRGYVKSFVDLMDQCFEEHVYRVPQQVSSKMSEIAQQLAALGAGPRDVVEIYGTALKHKLGVVPRARSTAYSEIGQILALELMGYLASQYRNLARTAGAKVAQ